MIHRLGRLAVGETSVLIAVGAAFDFHAGLVPQAPPWIGRNGLEWAYRLARDPGMPITDVQWVLALTVACIAVVAVLLAWRVSVAWPRRRDPAESR